MWRWVIRVYVAFVMFCVLTFVVLGGVIWISRRLHWIGITGSSQVIREHPLSALFLVGIIAGQVYLGSNITGRGWFRSKSGLTYEGFKLEKVKPWTWLMLLPISLFWLVALAFDQRGTGELAHLSMWGFLREMTVPNCAAVPLKESYRYPDCSTPLLVLGPWVTSIGYSLAPMMRRLAGRSIRGMKSAIGACGLPKQVGKAH